MMVVGRIGGECSLVELPWLRAERREKMSQPWGGFSYKKRASTRHSQGALGWETSLGFPSNSHWLRGIVVVKVHVKGMPCTIGKNVILNIC